MQNLPTVYDLFLPEVVHYHLHSYCDAHTAYLRQALNICSILPHPQTIRYGDNDVILFK